MFPNTGNAARYFDHNVATARLQDLQGNGATVAAGIKPDPFIWPLMRGCCQRFQASIQRLPPLQFCTHPRQPRAYHRIATTFKPARENFQVLLDRRLFVTLRRHRPMIQALSASAAVTGLARAKFCGFGTCTELGMLAMRIPRTCITTSCASPPPRTSTNPGGTLGACGWAFGGSGSSRISWCV